MRKSSYVSNRMDRLGYNLLGISTLFIQLLGNVKITILRQCVSSSVARKNMLILAEDVVKDNYLGTTKKVLA
ncbi:MAG: hypothetical protein JKY42_06250 [Flavobacteriales bacterium]|nr:hypothetical protein [Flavobacteriales bacterium]